MKGKVFIFLLLSNTICLASIRATETYSIAFSKYINALKEYVSDIVISKDKSLAFILINNSIGSRQRILYVELVGELKIHFKELHKRVINLETVSNDNRYLITRDFNLISIGELFSDYSSVVNIISTATTDLLQRALCLKNTNTNSMFVAITSLNEIYLVSSKTNSITQLNTAMTSNCKTITTSLYDPILYGISSLMNITSIKYFTNTVVYNTIVNTDSINRTQQLYVSPLNNYLVYLSDNQLSFYYIGNNDIRLIAVYEKKFLLVDFLEDERILACEFASGSILVMSFNTSGLINVLPLSISKNYLSAIFCKSLNSHTIFFADSLGIKIIQIVKTEDEEEKVLSNYVLIIYASTATLIMLATALYFLICKEHNQVNTQTDIPNPSKESGVLDLDPLNCPLTQQMMQNPVITSDGHTYERAAIEEWLKYNNTSPITGEEVKSKEIVNNVVLGKVVKLYNYINKR